MNAATDFQDSRKHEHVKPTGAGGLLSGHGLELPTFTLKSTTQLILVIVLIITSLTGNSTICILIKRFKRIRTIPDLFLANLAIVDTLNTVINMPFFFIVDVFELNQMLRGRAVSLLVTLVQGFFIVLKIMSMLAIMTDRFVAITWAVKYHVWKTKTKAAKAICAVWLVSVVVMLPWVMLASQIDLGDAPTYNYRVAYFDEFGKQTAFCVFSIFAAIFTVLSLMTCFRVKKQKAKCNEKECNNPFQVLGLHNARAKNQAQAMCTISLTTAVHILCYMPCILYASFIDDKEQMTETTQAKWFGLVANYFLFVPSACNPLIYLARSRRFRMAIKQLLKIPCGSQDVQAEKPPTKARALYNEKVLKNPYPIRPRSPAVCPV